jgi:predicted outer membrane repeat protein
MKTAICILVILAAIPCRARTITVDDNAQADFNNIQAAIDDANDGDTVLVADGTYTGHGNRYIDIRDKTITVKSESGPENCIIDAKNSARVFQVYQEAADSVLDGFTITRGMPKTPMLTWYGGAILGSPTIRNCIFVANYADYGGAIYGDPTIINCVFSDNEASCFGSAIYCYSATIVNCTISNNLSTSNGEDAAAVTCSGYTTIINSILWNNEICQIAGGSPTVTYSDVEGGWPGDGNIDIDPCFSAPENDDYHLMSQAGRWDANERRWTTDDVTSLCIDAGDPMSPIGHEAFPNGGRINMGAYGGTAEASKSYFGEPPCETIVAGDINGDCAVNFLDFGLMAAHWLEEHY